MLVIVACENYLEEDPKAFISSTNFYQNESDAQAAIAAAYASTRPDFFGTWYNAFLVLHGGYADGRGSQAPISIYDQVLDQQNIGRAGTFWNSHYSAINRANAVLDNVSQTIDISDELKSQILGEAHFLRAVSYFNLVRGYGPIPLRISETRDLADIEAPRAPESEVYAQILEDALVAEKNLPDTHTEGTGRAGKWAAKMLLANIYLTLGQWDQARDKANEVINSGIYTLVPVTEADDFYNIFRQRTHSEDIMSIQHNETSQSGIVTFMHRANIPPYNPVGSGFFAWLPIENSFIGDSWDDNDLRKAFNLYTEYDDGTGNIVPLPDSSPKLFKKYIDMPDGLQTHSIPVYRYTEAFLIYAEAANEAEGGPSAEALENLNIIKRRGYGYDFNTPSPVDYPAGMSQSDFREAVWQELDYEFVLEGKRWWNLKRTGRVKETFQDIGRTIIDERLLWPLPENEINTNPALTEADQNPGY